MAAATSASEPLCEPAHQVDKAQKLIHVGPAKGRQHTATVLMLHGFGDSAAGWFEPAMFWAQRLPHVRFVLPTAPVSNTMGTTSWFDFGGGDMASTFDASVRALGALIQQEEAVVGAGCIVVAGFSQGGALAYHLGLTRAGQRLGGVVAMSTFLLPEVDSKFSADARETPILICHGTADDRIPGGADGARRARERLVKFGVSNVELKIYEGMGHSATDGELLDILQWLRHTLPSDASSSAAPGSRL
eukprot:CAMPEP_0177345256 /NCGR_PEP_ID=MMETSP0368-20130122/28549_1 /TAXON_ID=447022 ORGANISM="Scrippsiella hangoei-like, Strain SHHI-4" /NCGR_SAMPLE_ID=MMETSP0368 /ASSEMBLY_ACC=CAM_ASM_000363 /LENGTH=245 /DNA_ID=CAMNT_0018806817 /DNA_START=1 /DNA_END=738 /DNA_ORIENTATION=-